MFNSNQISRLRKIVDQGALPRTFDEIYLAERRIKLAPEAVGAVTLRDFYSPEFIFGVPHDSICLRGVVDSSLTTPVPVLKVLSDACVVGCTSVVSGEHLHFPELVTHQTIVRLEAENKSNYHGFLLYREGDEARVIYGTREKSEKIRSKALFVPNIEQGNYGSFIFRQLPQLIAAKAVLPEIDCYIAAERTPWLASTISLLGLPDCPIFSVNEVCGEQFDTIYAFNSLDSEGLLSDETLRGVRALAEICSQKHQYRGSKNIYVSRALSALYRPNYRRFLNEADLRSKLPDSFKIIYPEALSMSQQVAIFANADRIIGPSGSGMLNAVFASAKTKVLDLESFTFCVRQHAKIYSSTEKRYSFGFGEVDSVDERSPVARNWTMPPDVVDKGLSWLMD